MSTSSSSRRGDNSEGSPPKKAKFIDLSNVTTKGKNSLYVQHCKGRFILAFGTVGDHTSLVKAWCEPFKNGK